MKSQVVTQLTDVYWTHECCVPGTGLSPEDAALNRTGHCPPGVSIQVGKAAVIKQMNKIMSGKDLSK